MRGRNGQEDAIAKKIRQAAVETGPIESIEDLMRFLSLLTEVIPPGDGREVFPVWYLEVTRRIQNRCLERTWNDPDPEWMATLVAIFGERYRVGIVRGSPAWKKWLKNSTQPSISYIQCGMAGVAAHIIGDLGEAVRATTERTGRPLHWKTPTSADFHGGVNQIIEEVEGVAMQNSLDGILRRISRRVDPFDRKAVMLSFIVPARRFAGLNGMAATAIQSRYKERAVKVVERQMQGLELLATIAVRAILTPVPQPIVRLTGRIETLI